MLICKHCSFAENYCWNSAEAQADIFGHLNLLPDLASVMFGIYIFEVIKASDCDGEQREYIGLLEPNLYQWESTMPNRQMYYQRLQVKLSFFVSK